MALTAHTYANNAQINTLPTHPPTRTHTSFVISGESVGDVIFEVMHLLWDIHVRTSGTGSPNKSKIVRGMLMGFKKKAS